MKAARVVELILEDISRSDKHVNLMNYTCVRNLIKWGDASPDAEWYELVESTINIDADKFHEDNAPNIHKLLCLFLAYTGEMHGVNCSYTFFASVYNWDYDWKVELQKLENK